MVSLNSQFKLGAALSLHFRSIEECRHDHPRALSKVQPDLRKGVAVVLLKQREEDLGLDSFSGAFDNSSERNYAPMGSLGHQRPGFPGHHHLGLSSLRGITGASAYGVAGAIQPAVIGAKTRGVDRSTSPV